MDTTSFRIDRTIQTDAPTTEESTSSQHPERIDEITELAAVPCARSILTRLNAPGGRFMTLGFEAGLVEGEFRGYIEFAFRDPAQARRTVNYFDLIEAFSAWLTVKYPEHVSLILAAFTAQLQSFYLHGTPHGDKITLWFRATSQETCDQLLEILTSFLLEPLSSEASSD